jgi:hypothetical protein
MMSGMSYRRPTTDLDAGDALEPPCDAPITGTKGATAARVAQQSRFIVKHRVSS